jgi:RHS repeat-associated protein
MIMRTTLALCTLAACAPSTNKSIGAETVAHSSQFAYDATGMPTRITLDGTAHAVPASPRDTLGRATAVNGTALAYGPDGALARATRGANTYDFVTDELGHRLAKRKNGAFVEAYVDEGVVSDTLYIPVRFASATVGIVHHGGFESIAADPRGTVLADSAGVTRAGAFGERARPPALAAAIDYAQSGRDADLGLVRMGVRDYDPATHRFTSPDPLFLAHPEKCVASPVECNLYTYARDRPADFVDPNGTDANAIVSFGAEFVGVELIFGEKEWSAKIDLGVVSTGLAFGVTSKDVAKCDIGVRGGYEASAKIGSWNIASAKLEGKNSYRGGSSIEASQRLGRTGGTVKFGEKGLTAYGDIRSSGKLPGLDADGNGMKFAVKAGPTAAVSITMNSREMNDAVDGTIDRMSSKLWDYMTSWATESLVWPGNRH